MLPYLVELYSGDFNFSNAVLFTLFERLSQLVFLYLVGRRWISKISLEKPANWQRGLIALLISGFIVWAALIIPVLVQLMALQSLERIILLIILGPVLVFWFRYYFYFFAPILGLGLSRDILIYARTFTMRDPYLPWKTLIGPIAIWSLIEALTTALSPDGRLIEAYYLKCVFAGVFWCFSTYLSIAAGLLYLPEKIWHDSKLDPYREARLTTLTIGIPTLLSSLLSQKSGIKIIIVSLVLWFANFITLQTLTPAPNITVENIAIRNEVVELSLSLKDPHYNFRGFQPINFLLAGEKGAMISTEASTSIEKESGKNVSLSIPDNRNEITIKTTFKTNRSGENLKALEDLHLWYRSYKVCALNMNEAKIEMEAQITNLLTHSSQ